jgi:hypothetical protein
MFPSCFRALLSYRPEIGSDETDGAVATSGEAEFCPRRETLGKRPGLIGTSVVSPWAFRPYLSECVLRGIIRVYLIITPDKAHHSRHHDDVQWARSGWGGRWEGGQRPPTGSLWRVPIWCCA